MASFDTVNYSLRPSKSIQRQIVFHGIRTLLDTLNLQDPVYIGLGSIWFTDFVMAHKLLDIEDMISIESHPIGYRRALFNKPYATVSVRHGVSSAVLPHLYCDKSINCRPWVIWLDYDYEISPDVVAEVKTVIENAPKDTVFLITFNGNEEKYGPIVGRPDLLRDIYDDIVPDDLSMADCKEPNMQEHLATFTSTIMQSIAAEMARDGGFVSAFRLIYEDTTPMVTVGGFLPNEANRELVKTTLQSPDWRCLVAKRIRAPHLSIREATALQSKLPAPQGISRTDVQSLGFDLEHEQVEAFVKYYREYPSFAQIVA